MPKRKTNDTLSRGEDRYCARLDEPAVIQIRASSDKNASLAAHYGVAESTIEHVKRGRTWKHVA